MSSTYDTIITNIEKSKSRKEWNDSSISSLVISVSQLSPTNKDFLLNALTRCYEEEQKKVMGENYDNTIYNGVKKSGNIPGLEIDFKNVSKKALDVTNEFIKLVKIANS